MTDLNCYNVTTTAAQTYFDFRINAGAWDNASDADRAKALVQSARLIDSLNIIGTKAVSTQLLAFPRLGQLSVPTEVLRAECEIALALLDGKDPNYELDNMNVSQTSFSGVSTTMDGKALPEHVANGIPSGVAWRNLRPYLKDPNTITLSRAN